MLCIFVIPDKLITEWYSYFVTMYHKSLIRDENLLNFTKIHDYYWVKFAEYAKVCALHWYFTRCPELPCLVNFCSAKKSCTVHAMSFILVGHFNAGVPCVDYLVLKEEEWNWFNHCLSLSPPSWHCPSQSGDWFGTHGSWWQTCSQFLIVSFFPHVNTLRME